MSRQFPETHWSQLIELGNPSHPAHQEHLESLVRRYWKPIYFYVRALRTYTREDAEDLTQDFFEMLLRRVDFAALTPERGSFRGFLKTALKRFVVSADRKRENRGTHLLRFSDLDLGWFEMLRQKLDLTPEEAFDRAWARDVMEEASARIKATMEIEGKPQLFEIFRDYTMDDGLTYGQLAEKHGMSVDDVRNGLRTVRQKGRELIKEILRDYLFPDEDIEAELRFILSR